MKTAPFMAIETRDQASYIQCRLILDPADRSRSLFKMLIGTGKHLTHAEPFWWSAETAQAVSLSAQTFPEDTPVTPNMSYADNAWFWFDVPPFSVEGNEPGQRDPVVAIHVMWAKFIDTGNALREGTEGLITTAYVKSPEGLVLPILTASVMSGNPIIDNSADTDSHVPVGMDPAVVRTERIFLMKFVAAAGSWMRSRLVTTEPTTVERHFRKRYIREKQTNPPLLRVVALRRRDRSTTPTGNPATGKSPVEWSCQWAVVGHWRNQFYPSTGEHFPRFISDYWKGPEGLPIKAPSPRLFMVAR